MAGHFKYPPVDLQNELRSIANSLVAPGKGILAADDPIPDMGTKLQKHGLENTLKNRGMYQEMLFTTDHLGDYISGVILTEEALYQKTATGTRFVDVLKTKGILAGINVDKGLVPISTTDNELSTHGLDGLGTRCAQYKKDGAQFAKWRCVIKISLHAPSPLAIKETSTVLAKYAAICQMHRLVPIVEPDIVLDGDHDIEKCQKVTESVLSFVYEALRFHNVYLEGTVLKTNMVTPGKSCLQKATPADIAKATVMALQRSCPAVVPGVGFLSGGQSEQEATLNLNAINIDARGRIGPRNEKKTPWMLTFCFGRALQNTVWDTWQGKSANVKAAQNEFVKRAKANCLASVGKY